MFEIGQRIVCINASGFPGRLIPDWYSAFPEEGKVYVVRDLVPAGKGFGEVKKEIANTCGILLQGIRNPINDNGVENAYDYTRFRPLEEHEQHCLSELVESI